MESFVLHSLNAQFPLADLKVDPAFPVWVLIPAAVLVAVLIFYLYSAQRQIASRRIVNWLTAIRISLILLLALLLMRPQVTWNNVTQTPETLWLVLDQSLSMAQKDKQATGIERLRWADSLGLLPPQARPEKLDRAQARLEALHGDLVDYLQKAQVRLKALHEALLVQQKRDTGADEKETARLTQDYDNALKKWNAETASWNAELTDLVARLEKDPKIQESDNASIARDLHAASDQCSAALGSGSDLPWEATATTLHAARDRVKKLADKTDEELLKSPDPAVKAALDQVATMRRADIAYAALTGKSADLPRSMLDVLEHQTTRVVTFAGGQQIIAASKAEIPKAIKAGIEPTGTLTDLDDALKFVADHVGPNERATVLVVSDGRSNDGGDPSEAARTLGSRGVRVFTLGLGTKELARDAAVESIEAPEWIYKDDTLTVTARIRLDNITDPTTVHFRHVGDAKNVKDIASKLLTPTGNKGIKHDVSVVTFKDKPAAPGTYGYRISVDESPNEVTTENNAQEFRLTVKDEKLNVILVQDQPRWEDRYIATYLKRDKRVHLQQVLREPASLAGVSAPTPTKASPVNTGDQAQLLPETAEEWAAFDLIVLGDVPPDFLTAKQQENIATAITKRGTALLVMAGPFSMPTKYSAMPLADLLPVKMESRWTHDDMEYDRVYGIRLEIAPEGAGSVLSRFDVNDDTNTRYRAALDAGEPIGYWHSEQTLAKPSAHVLWRIKPVPPPKTEANREALYRKRQASDDATDPLATARQRALLALMPAGYGRVVYLSGDSLWRMRYVYVPNEKATSVAAEVPEVGVNLADRFWGQLVRFVVQSDLPAGGKFVRFGTSKPRYIYGDPVIVNVRLLNPDFTLMKDQKFKVVARNLKPIDPSATQAATHVAGQLKGDKIIAMADAVENPASPGTYSAALIGIDPGGIEISLQGEAVEKLLNDDPVATQKAINIDMLSGTDREMRNVNADPVALARIAGASRGITSDIAYADIVAQHIPNLDIPIPSTQRVGLFTDPESPYTKKAHWAFLILFVVLITTEWVIRKVGGLV